ncbi:hypothetical protein MNBD_GAMMA12-3380 [hydrothermal vent metagenome]|uniref:DUF560 domain-containing protein n=1 Tax=hydrothermal vent metagenome TaxID=652676 RepID=A0A3B0YDT2_9ZZZZ
MKNRILTPKYVISVLLLIYMSLAYPATLHSASNPAVKLSVEDKFNRAMKLRSDGKLEESIKAFQGILSNNPTLQRARLELAVAYFFSLKYIKALKQARQVLADTNTPSNVKATIREFIAKIRSKRPRHKYIPFLSLGFISDSNVTAGPDQNILAGFPLIAASQKQSDFASVLRLGVSHRFNSDINLNLGKKSAALLWLSKAGYYRANYQDVSASDLSILSLSSGPALVSEGNWRSGLNFKLESIDLGTDKYATFTAINHSVTRTSKDSRQEVTLELLVQDRDYKRAVDLGRDSEYIAVGLSYGRILTNDKASYQAGFRLFDEKSDSEFNSNDGVEVFIGLSWRFSRFNSSYARMSYKTLSYGGIGPGFTVIRDENVARLLLGYDHRIRKSWLKGWTISSQVTISQSTSNEAVFEYDRTQVGVTFKRNFD